jgi:hypothetical protein
MLPRPAWQQTVTATLLCARAERYRASSYLQAGTTMKKQRGTTQAERDFDAEVAKFNQEAQKILDDRSLPMSTRRRLISLKGKALLRRPAPGAQADATR